MSTNELNISMVFLFESIEHKLENKKRDKPWLKQLRKRKQRLRSQLQTKQLKKLLQKQQQRRRLQKRPLPRSQSQRRLSKTLQLRKLQRRSLPQRRQLTRLAASLLHAKLRHARRQRSAQRLPRSLRHAKRLPEPGNQVLPGQTLIKRTCLPGGTFLTTISQTKKPEAAQAAPGFFMSCRGRRSNQQIETLYAPLHHQLFKFSNGFCRVESFRTSFGAVHNRVAAKKPEWIFKVIQPVTRRFVARVIHPAICLQ
jgi:hypothetical protein